MRITNKMMSNNSLININGNKEYLDRLNTQMATEKKITRPSDDPIVAIRALRLRSDLSQVTQYYGANVPDAQSWVSVTQKAIDSTMDMLSSMRALCNQGANGTNTTAEREKIYEALKGYKGQIYLNGNTTTAGRTVFTGYRTGEKLTFTEDTEADYRGIADTFNAKDVMKNTYVETQVSPDNINSLKVGKSVGNVTEVGLIEINGKTGIVEKDTSGDYKTPLNLDGKDYDVSKEGEVTLPYNGTITNKVTKYTEVSLLGKTQYLADGVKEFTGDDSKKYIIDGDGNIRENYENTVISPPDAKVETFGTIKIDGQVVQLRKPTFSVNGKSYKVVADLTGTHVYRDYDPNETIGILDVESRQIDIGGSLYPDPALTRDPVTGKFPVTQFSIGSTTYEVDKDGVVFEISTNPDEPNQPIGVLDKVAWQIKIGDKLYPDPPTNTQFSVGDTTYEVDNGVVYKKSTYIGDATGEVYIATIDGKEYTLEKDSGSFKDLTADGVVYGFDNSYPSNVEVIKKYSSEVYGSAVQVEGVDINSNIYVVEKSAGGHYGNITVDDVVYTIDVDTEGKVTKAFKTIGKLEDGGKITIGVTDYTVKKDVNGHYGVISTPDKTYMVSDSGEVTEVENGELTVKEDKVNRIRLSYDNISGSVTTGPNEGWDGDELDTVTNLSASDDDYGKYFNKDGTLNDAGRAWSDEVTIDGMKVTLKFNEPFDQTFKFDPEYTKTDIKSSTSVSVDANTNSIKVGIKVVSGNLTYTITKDTSGNYSVDKGASVKADSSGNLTLTIPGPNGTKDIYTEIVVKNDGSEITSAGKYKKIGEINYWIDPYSSDHVESKVTLAGDENEFTVKIDGSTYTIKKDGSDYTADNGATVTVGNTGNLTVTIPGSNGTKDNYTEVIVKPSPLTTVEAKERTLTAKQIRGYTYGGTGEHSGDLRGKAFGTKTSDTTELVYRTELSQTASIPQKSVTTDPVDGLQSFEIKYGSTTYTIKKFKDEGRWFAVDGSGDAIHTIKVTQNTDKSFTIEEDTSSSTPGVPKTAKVFNVSANGRTVTSYYCEHKLDVQITDSTSAVAVKDGKELTAYQYLALDPNDKNSDPVAAEKIYLLADTGELVFGSNIANTLSSLKDIDGVDTISIKYDKDKFDEGDLRPEHYFDCVELTGKDTIVDPTVYDNHNQEIKYTVGANQNIQINTNAEDVFDTQIKRELDDILRAIDDYNQAEEKVNKLKEMQQDTNTYDEEAQKKITVLLDAANKELDFYQNKLQKSYETGITSFKNFYEQANLANTNCGTIDSRLTLISNRLMEQKATVTTLASENENVDITNIAVEVKEAELVYNAALMATGKISQHSLVDYI